MLTDDLRQSYLEFFRNKDHLVVDSAPLIPQNDPTVLWVNSGMFPLKPFFSGQETPPHHRMASCQKCIRTGDIENVGRTARHHTFFEMLGNFSFGDYFKEEAIAWGWEYVTDILNLPEDKLIATIYKDDDESFKIWQEKIGLPETRIVRMGKEDNFWQIGTGPCGPCSEIHIDRGPEFGTGPEDVLGGEGDRYLELWNLVFTQYDYTEEGEYLELPQKNIDTGMGLERTASVLQGTKSNYEIDIIKPLLEEISRRSGYKYDSEEKIQTAFRVIADHLRGVTMAVLDGALPSNEGRGYVIRRLLRRASRYGLKLDFQEPFLHEMVASVVEIMKVPYPEVKEQEEHISRVVYSEEERFLNTLDQGLEILEDKITALKSQNRSRLSGEEAFELYDTYGFPPDLTRDVLVEEGLEIDLEGFEEEMDKQRQRARQARQVGGFVGKADEIYEKLGDKIDVEQKFVGYHNLETEGKILAIISDGEEVGELKSGEKGEAILSSYPFYAEGGGQVGDKGRLTAENEDLEVLVKDMQQKNGFDVAVVEVKKGKLQLEQKVRAAVTRDLREATARNHTATHLLHQALMDLLGDHVNQSGSLVAPKRLRFDFTHFKALTPEELRSLEREVNRKIMANLSVETYETTVEEARKKGAQALFEEKYEDKVRVVQTGDYSLELCGGTHVSATGEIGLFKISQESSIAAGVRRIEAKTGLAALELIEEQEDILQKAARDLKVEPSDLPARISQLQAETRELKRQLKSLQDRFADSKANDLIKNMEEINGISVLLSRVEGIDKEALRNLSDEIVKEISSGIVILALVESGSLFFVARVTSDLIKEGFKAGDLIGQIAAVTGGGGGGRPDMAQAGGSQPGKLPEAFDLARELIADRSN